MVDSIQGSKEPVENCLRREVLRTPGAPIIISFTSSANMTSQILKDNRTLKISKLGKTDKTRIKLSEQDQSTNRRLKIALQGTKLADIAKSANTRELYLDFHKTKNTCCSLDLMQPRGTDS